MAPLLDDDVIEFVDENNAKRLVHPYVTFFHIAFRSAALMFYILSGWLSQGFISSFVLIVMLLSVDFWMVKNITGRLMVGLRWWNYIDEAGVSSWVFESRKGKPVQNRINSSEARIFWMALVLAPALWALFFLVALLSFKFKWLLLVCIALTSNGANLYGYMKCKVGHSDQSFTSVVNDFVRKQVSQNMASMVIRTNVAPSSNNIQATNVV